MVRRKQLFFDFKREGSYSINDTIVGSFNKNAVHFLFGKDKWLSNVVYIYGNSGVGKTYLCKLFLKQNNGYEISLNELTKPTNTQHLLDKYKVFLLEDIVNLTKEQEIGLFNLYNRIVYLGLKFIITSSLPPKDLEISLPDLKSRINSSILIEIDDLDDISLKIMIFKLLTDRQLIVSKESIEYILKRVKRSSSEIQEVVKKLENAVMEKKKNLSIQSIKNILNI